MCLTCLPLSLWPFFFLFLSLSVSFTLAGAPPLSVSLPVCLSVCFCLRLSFVLHCVSLFLLSVSLWLKFSSLSSLILALAITLSQWLSLSFSVSVSPFEVRAHAHTHTHTHTQITHTTWYHMYWFPSGKKRYKACTICYYLVGDKTCRHHCTFCHLSDQTCCCDKTCCNRVLAVLVTLDSLVFSCSMRHWSDRGCGMSPLTQLWTFKMVPATWGRCWKDFSLFMKYNHWLHCFRMAKSFGEQSNLESMMEPRYLFSPWPWFSSLLVTSGQGTEELSWNRLLSLIHLGNKEEVAVPAPAH